MCFWLRCGSLILAVIGLPSVCGEVQVVDSQASRPTQDSEPQGLVVHDGAVYASARPSGARVRPLWRLSEGVPGGAQRVTTHSVSDFKVSCGEALYYWAETDLWSLFEGKQETISDWYGDDDWTPRPVDRLVGCDEATGTFLFVMVDRTGNDASSLWLSEGQAESTRKLFDFPLQVRGDRSLFYTSGARIIVQAAFQGQDALWTLDITTGAFDPVAIGDRLAFGAFFDGALLFSRREASGEWTLNALDLETSVETEVVRLESASGNDRVFDEFQQVGDRCYFTSISTTRNRQYRDLWITDGRVEGTVRLTNHRVAEVETSILGSVGDILLTQDWRTTSNTYRFHETIGNDRKAASWDPMNLKGNFGSIRVGEKELWFTANLGNGRQLMQVTVENGETTARAVTTRYVSTGPDREGYGPVLLDGRLWYIADDEQFGEEVFSIGFEAQDVRLERDINTEPVVRRQLWAWSSGGGLLFGSGVADESFRVGRYDRNGSQMDEIAGLPDEFYRLSHGGGEFYFEAFGGIYHFDLESRQATVVVADPGRVSPSGGLSLPLEYTVIDGRLLYLREDLGRFELVAVARGEVPTSLVADVAPGEIFQNSGKGYFVGSSRARDEIWETDGTPAGTRLVYKLSPEDEVDLFIRDIFSGVLVLEAFGGPNSGLTVLDLATGEAVRPEKPEGMSGRRYLRATERGVLMDAVLKPDEDRSLWVVAFDDPRYERMIVDPPLMSNVLGFLGNPLVLESGRTIIIGKTADAGAELWEIDGLQLTRLTDLRSSDGDGVTGNSLVRFRNRVYFTGNDGVHGDELHVLDLASGGTSLAEDLRVGPESSAPRDLRVVGNSLLFWAASDQSRGFVLHALTFDPIQARLRWVGDDMLEMSNDDSVPMHLYQSETMRTWSRLDDLSVSPGRSRIETVSPNGGRRFYRLAP